ncbi:hypothetical protein GLAREA_07833 [Glarea lozoyensis ATCC 20868]|uniref:HAUS augmin-like complex subunit 3 N-terminal domain-containing protein n=1 Tax=Glarea lozoyensis (strain ATCC 20868 / MF5171) TaxID=1116229 RepID=S3D6E1_GLAL2|nr:uncharacterized protein GLAREA_07833 [Glarea lozoyensis ATCC 20868]EPE32699.1 hypothetical protein GLAREA_07833 [Glarea lozoyensis ATCC 20868]
MSDKSLEELVKILLDRDIPFDRDELRSAFKAPESRKAIQEWMQEYLTPETLLTKEEADLYAALTKSGDVERLSSQDLSGVQALNESEIEDAIEELKRSTAAIEKQTESIRLQQNAMRSLVKNEQRAREARASSTAAQHRKWSEESAQVSKAIEELSQNLRYQISDLEQHMKVSETTAKQTVETILTADDKLLASLQKLAADLDPINTEDIETMSRIKELSARLIKHTVEGIRTRLDRIYLEALQSSNITADDNNQENQDLQDELESLYSEILPVAQMSAEQQFLQPALRTMAASSGKSQERAVKAVEYIHSCLTYLNARLSAYQTRTSETRAHNHALTTILSTTKSELTQSLPPPLPKSNLNSSPSKPALPRRRTSSLTHPPNLHLHRRRSSGIDLDPETQIARNLGITLPPTSATAAQVADSLGRIRRERSTKLGIHATSLQTTTEGSIAAHVAESQVALRVLTDALLAESAYGGVRLVDPDVEASVGMFEGEVEGLKKEMEGLDLEVLRGRSVDGERFVKRWTR